MPLVLNEDDQIVKICKAIGSDTRLEILKLCRKTPLPVNKIAKRLGFKISTVSAHIAQLQAAGLVQIQLLPWKRSTVRMVSVIQDEVLILIVEDEEIGEACLPDVRGDDFHGEG